MADNSALDPLQITLKSKAKAFSFCYIYDYYVLDQRDVFFYNAPFKFDNKFTSHSAEVGYAFKYGERLTLTPTVQFKRQNSWEASDPEVLTLDQDEDGWYTGVYGSEQVERLSFNLAATYDLDDKTNITAGVDYYKENATQLAGEEPLYNGNLSISFDNLALFAQTMYMSDFANITVGARYEEHSDFDGSFVPRLGLTKVWNAWHSKLLYSKAFRAPGLHNLVDFRDPEGIQEIIRPENTTVSEIEVGHRFGDTIFLTGNLFDIRIEDPIVYYYEDGDAYRNYPETGTQGLELEFKVKDQWGYMNLAYSYYKLKDNQVDQYAVRNEEDEIVETDMAVGFPTHKLTLNTSFKLNNKLALNPSVIFESMKWAYVAVNEDDALIPGKIGAATLVNINVIYRDLLTDGLDLSLGIRNILDENYLFAQPYYDGYHAPYPGPSREIVLKLSKLR